MKVVCAPNKVDWRVPYSIFLAGSIEMGRAEKWQDEVIKMFGVHCSDTIKQITQILNPRRPDWDSSWEQKFDNPQFSQQVRWEIDSLQRANWILFYFDPGTISPISLLELGTFKSKNIVVVCPEGYMRKGNVDIFCDVYNITQLDTLHDAVKHINLYLN